jgi:hypothetical protein
MSEQEFITQMLLFINNAAGEGIGQEIDGEVVWADELMFNYFNELSLQRQPCPSWCPQHIYEDWKH